MSYTSESNAEFVLRGPLLHCLDDPMVAGDDAWQYLADGALWVANGRIKACEDYASLRGRLPVDCAVEALPDRLIMPGFVDCHVHYPQTEIIGAWGRQLLDWLTNYAFICEQKFVDKAYARRIADFFLKQLLRNGTTSALVFATVHPQSVDAFFEAAQEQGLRMICGKVLMDRNAPCELLDTAELGYHQSRALIERWHGVDRLQYAVTPRFAPTSTSAQLSATGELLSEYDDVYMHTHLAENHDELAWVQSLFPQSADYTDVYAQHNLLGKRSVFAHCLHLDESQCQSLAQHHCGVAHCPTSNQFLGSGLFQLQQLHKHGLKIGLGTDVGGGTSFSMFRTMASAYEVQQQLNNPLDPFMAFYLATLGAAKTLDIDDAVGNFVVGKEADFIVVDHQATDYLKLRSEACESIKQRLFMLNFVADDRVIERTYAMGHCVYSRD